MTASAPDPLAPLIEALHASGRLRVWSLVITIFGDAVAPRGGQIAGARLQTLMERLGIEAGTLRTALSRLAQDRMIERRRDGRNAFYRLNATGIDRFGTATTRIYAPVQPAPAQSWILAVGPRPDEAEPGTILPLAENAWITRETEMTPLPPGAVAVRGALAAPVDLRPHLDPEHREAAERVGSLYAPDALRDLAPLDAMAARTLLIHDWRRVCLRFPDIPRALSPPDWEGHDLRGRVARCYAAVFEASEAWLSAGDHPLPPPRDGAATRFGGLNTRTEDMLL